MRPRPRYESRSSLPPDEVRERLRSALEQGGACAGYVSERHINLHIAEPERHVWSPWISVELVDEGEGTKLQGYFGPHPYLWGAFTAFYAAQVFIFIAGSVHGMVSLTLDMPLTGLWVAAAMVVSLGISCAFNIAGEWAGEPQMKLTRGFVADALAVAEAPIEAVGKG